MAFLSLVELQHRLFIIILKKFRVKKSLPEKLQKRTEASLVTALISATIATLTCYPLDTVRRQMQMKGTPYETIFDAFPGNSNSHLRVSR